MQIKVNICHLLTFNFMRLLISKKVMCDWIEMTEHCRRTQECKVKTQADLSEP